MTMVREPVEMFVSRFRFFIWHNSVLKSEFLLWQVCKAPTSLWLLTEIYAWRQGGLILRRSSNSAKVGGEDEEMEVDSAGEFSNDKCKKEIK